MRSLGTVALLAVAVGSLAGCPGKSAKTPPKPATPAAETAHLVDDPELVARNNRGVGLMGRFAYDEAQQVFCALAQEHPDWLDVKVNCAIATFNRQQEGDEEDGLRRLLEVLDVDQDHLRAHYCVGLLRLRRGEIDDAVGHFRTVAEADPADAYAAYAVGQCVEQTSPEEGLAWYRRAIEIDPYLRSAYYRAFQMLQRLGRADEAQRLFDDFQRLEKNPRARLVEVKYTRMGPKAEAVTVDVDPTEVPIPWVPEGPIFVGGAALLGPDAEAPPGRPRTTAPPSIAAADLDDDGRLDLIVAGYREGGDVRNAVLLSRGDADGRRFELDPGHVLASIPDVNAALFGDYDNDGRTDAYLCRHGPNMLLRQRAPGAWEDVTAATGTSNGNANTVDGALFDADHDGDLDIFCVNADGPNELLNNDLDGGFRAIAAAQGVGGGDRASRQVLPVDLDGDRDLDLVVINDAPPHDVYLNDRLWAYRSAPELDGFRGASIDAAVCGDADGDGAVEIHSIADGSGLVIWRPDDDGIWQAEVADSIARAPGPGRERLVLTDVDGDGRPDWLVGADDHGWRLETRRESGVDGYVPQMPPADLEAWSPVLLEPGRGPSVVGLRGDGELLVWNPGPGRWRFASLSFKGHHEEADSMRSNASGIGTHAVARVGSRWTALPTLGWDSGAGQSLQPVALGLGVARSIDFVAIDWSDGVFQSEIDLAAGETHAITETQRQLSSCPVLFAWNGTEYEFVSDLLGVGGIGFLLEPGAYSTPRPWERFLMPEGSLAPREERFHIKITEPMEEACYLDAVRLIAYDLPPGWRMVLDERMQVDGSAPTGATQFYRYDRVPVHAANDRGDVVTDLVATADRDAAPVGALDRRFLGRLEKDNVLTLTWTAPLDARPSPILVIDGWVEYPYSQTMFAAWQAGAEYRAPTIEARGADGRWHVVAERFGYPAGMPRRMSVPLDGLPAGATALRISTNLEVYFDRIAVAWPEPCPGARLTVLPPVDARLAETGFPLRVTGPQRLPSYEYGRRTPFWDTRHMSGLYTAFGPALELVAETDDALAIFGPGEEVHVETGSAPPPPAGWTRRFVVEVEGWCKDMDLFTRSGETVGPLPSAGPPSEKRETLHRRYNTRYESGR